MQPRELHAFAVDPVLEHAGVDEVHAVQERATVERERRLGVTALHRVRELDGVRLQVG